jgi:hypothetical protein
MNVIWFPLLQCEEGKIPNAYYLVPPSPFRRRGTGGMRSQPHPGLWATPLLKREGKCRLNIVVFPFTVKENWKTPKAYYLVPPSPFRRRGPGGRGHNLTPAFGHPSPEERGEMLLFYIIVPFQLFIMTIYTQPRH